MWAKTIKITFCKILDAVLPPRCLATGEIVDHQGMLDPKVWSRLRFITDPQCACCGYPFDFSTVSVGTFASGGREMLCAKCLYKLPIYKSARAAVVYDDASREMILRFKHADQTHAVLTFLPWLRRAGADMLSRADMLIPVPLHPLRLLRRRYNQAALIAQGLARECGMPYRPDILHRCRATKIQGYMGYKDRKKNVRGAFAVSPRAASDLAGKTIVLVDDVYTTGATVTECARALLAAGAASVHVLAVARVVRAE